MEPESIDKPYYRDVPPIPTTEGLRLRSPIGRGVLAATILGSGMTFLDSTVANIASDHIGHEFHAGIASLQWVVNAYTLVLAALILLGGSLGDRFGRRRVFVVGTCWFALASLGCAVAPGIGWLIALRAVQGIGAALMMPGSLAILSAVFVVRDRGAAVGAWSGLTGVASAAGPLLGGWLVQDYSWRWAFAINVPVAVAVVALALRYVPETRSAEVRRPDAPGIVTVALALGALSYGTTEAGNGWTARAIALTVAGVLLAVAFVFVERGRRHPLVPLGLFANRAFSGVVTMTFLAWGAQGVFSFVFVLDLQVAAGYGALRAGLATLPITILLLLFSARGGRLAARIGPRTPIVAGSLVAAAGMALLLRVDAAHRDYWTDVLPGVLVLAIGMTTVVAPVTAATMEAAPSDQVGIASGISNAVARAGALLMIATLPALAGLRGHVYRDAAAMTHGYRIVMLACAGLFVVSAGLVAATVGPRPAADPTRD